MKKPRYLTKSRFKLGLECETKLFYTGKRVYANQKLEDSFLEALAEGGYPLSQFIGSCVFCYRQVFCLRSHLFAIMLHRDLFPYFLLGFFQHLFTDIAALKCCFRLVIGQYGIVKGLHTEPQPIDIELDFSQHVQRFEHAGVIFERNFDELTVLHIVFPVVRTQGFEGLDKGAQPPLGNVPRF